MSLKFMWLGTHFLYFLVLLIRRINRQTYNHIVDWTIKHQEYVDMWADRENRKETDREVSTYESIQEYLRWYADGAKFRLRLRPRWTDKDMLNITKEDSSEDEYNQTVRNSQGYHREFAPVLDRVLSS